MPSLLQLLFLDLALCLVASGHASTVRKDRPVYMPGGAFLLSFSLVLHARLAPFPRLPFTTAFASLFLCLHSLSLEVFALPGALRLFWTESASLSELLVSALLRTLLNCASALFIFGSNTCLPVPSGSSEAVFACSRGI